MRWGAITRLILLCLLIFSGPVSAETRALLVGVSDYDDTLGIADLKGPGNDVRLLQKVLSGRGVQDISILADGVDGAARPTRNAILDALAGLAENAAKGDFIYIHLSGHGTRQKDQNGDETDGLDELFLPADTGRAQTGTGIIPNAIIDDEIGAAVQAIRLTGADVWLVMDSCFSGSGLRGTAPGTATRFVDPAVLGVKIKAVGLAETQVEETDQTEPEGAILAFYSARSTEVAHEVNMAEQGAPEQWYGLFSAKLAARLENGESASFRQLFQSVLRDMNDTSLPGGARMQTPIWEGSLIDAAVFGGTKSAGIRRFAVSGDEISAGKLHGMNAGTLVGLVANAADDPEAIIGHAQTESAGATHSILRPVATDCVPKTTGLCERFGALQDDAHFAQIIAHPADQNLRISWPHDLRSGEKLAAGSDTVMALHEAAQKVSARQSFTVELTETEFTVEAIWDGQSLWLGPSAIEGNSPVGLAWVPGAGELAHLLERIAKAEILAQTLVAVAGSGSILFPSPIEVLSALNPSKIGDLAEPGAGISPATECRAAMSAVQSQQPVALSAGSELKQCDALAFSVRGKLDGSRDVNRIHIDAEYCIHAAYERIVGAKVAQQLGQDMTMCSDCPGGYSAGEERLFVITTESRANSEALNLVGLVENCTPAGTATRGASSSQALDYLTRVGQRPGTRSSGAGLGISNVWVEQFNWRILPRREAFIRLGRSPKTNN